jgi:hypothetical protein
MDYSHENALIFSPFLGYRWRLSENYKLFSEIKWQGVNQKTDRIAVEYIHPGGNGAIGVYLTLERSFK